MALWNNPRWFDDKKRQEQLDDHIRATGKARFGIRKFEEDKKADRGKSRLCFPLERFCCRRELHFHWSRRLVMAVVEFIR